MLWDVHGDEILNGQSVVPEPGSSSVTSTVLSCYGLQGSLQKAWPLHVNKDAIIPL